MSVVLLSVLGQLAAGNAALPAQPTPPVLDFPEPGMDDPAAYEGYRTRFYRDAANNTVQIYIKGTEGRVVTLLADGANESVGFTVRDSTGQPVAPAWGAVDAIRSSTGDARSLEFRLTTNLRRIDLGWFLLGSMRVERDLQYQNRHRRRRPLVLRWWRTEPDIAPQRCLELGHPLGGTDGGFERDIVELIRSCPPGPAPTHPPLDHHGVLSTVAP